MKNTIVWYDLPVKNLGRAKKFYEAIFETELQIMENGKNTMAMFPFAPDSAGIALVEGPNAKPSDSAGVIYFNGGDDLALPLGRVISAGGSVVLDKTDMGDHGFMAQFKDTEGNIVALHTAK